MKLNFIQRTACRSNSFGRRFNRCLTNRSVNAIIAVQFRELDETQAERKSAFCYDFDL